MIVWATFGLTPPCAKKLPDRADRGVLPAPVAEERLELLQVGVGVLGEFFRLLPHRPRPAEDRVHPQVRRLPTGLRRLPPERPLRPPPLRVLDHGAVFAEEPVPCVTE